MSSTSDNVCNQSASEIIDHNQSPKDIDSYFKYQLCVEDPCDWKPVLILPSGVKITENITHERIIDTFSNTFIWKITVIYILFYISSIINI